MKLSKSAWTSIAAAIALGAAGCAGNAAKQCQGSSPCAASSSATMQSPPSIPSIALTPASPGSCRIDGVKMCRELGAGPGETVDFQIPAGQAIELKCFRGSTGGIVSADATPQSALTSNSVAYLKSRGFCAR